MRADELNQVPEHLCCPITGELMTDPVSIRVNGALQTYERSAILAWFTIKNTDPITNVVVEDQTLLDNIFCKSAIEHYKAQEAKLKSEEKSNISEQLPISKDNDSEDNQKKANEKRLSNRSYALFSHSPVSFENKPEHTIKIGILGSCGSGGGKIIHRYKDCEYNEKYDKGYYDSAGVKKSLTVDGKKIELQIFRDPFGGDPRSGRRYRLFPRNFYDCIILVADLTDVASLSFAKHILLRAQQEENFNQKPLIFCGTKSEAISERAWDLNSVNLADYDHLITCSAKSNENIRELFEFAIRKRLELLENPKPIEERNKPVEEKPIEKTESKCNIM